MVFAPHNLLGDPPFSQLDLIACRNVLIYLQRDVQQDVMELFHYALKPDGFLVLGTSETVERSELFRSRDNEARASTASATCRPRSRACRSSRCVRLAGGAGAEPAPPVRDAGRRTARCTSGWWSGTRRPACW